MRSTLKNLIVTSALLALFAGTSPAKTTAKTHHAAKHSSGKASAHSSSSRKASHRKGRKVKASWKRHGQQGMQSERVEQIQEALIREHYLSGEPSGQWDSQTQAAMVRFQADNGWQAKVTPDSRALIKLGLGPDYSQQELLRVDSRNSDAIASNARSAGVNSQNK